MSGLDIAAAAAQVVSIAFQIFGACVDAYKLFHAAQRIGVDGDFLRIKIQIERDRLQRWADRVGLASARPHPRLNWAAIVEILRLQQAILTSAEKLKKKYGLDLPEIEDQQAVEEKVEANGLERFLVVLRPEFYSPSNATKTIAAANGPLKRLQWAVVGREKVVKVIDDLGSLNGDLERLLEAIDQEWLQSGMTLLLRELLSRSTDLNEVEEVQDILRPRSSASEESLKSVADFKRVRLVLGVDKRADEVQPRPSQQLASTVPVLKMLKEKKLEVKTDMSQARVQCGTYGVRSVLVEWRKPDDTDPSELKKRMQGLALLLGSTPPAFATLNCMGLLVAKTSGSFGLVYEMPPMLDTDPDAEFEYRTLRSLIQIQRKVSLRVRLDIACRLADAVLQLHTAGWLHKSIHSENIVFIASSSASPTDFLAGNPYLIGYDHARPDTESTITKASDTSLYTDLYHHPERRGVAKSRYRKSHDLFALGCLLVEIALWEPLIDVLSSHSDQDWTSLISQADAEGRDLQLPSLRDLSLKTSFAEDITHAVGPTFLEAVQACFSKECDDSAEISLDGQVKVVDLLRQHRV